MGAGDGGRSIVRFFIDESIPESVRRSLAMTRDDVTYPGHPACPVVRGTKDEVWLPVIGARDWIVILRDRQIRYRSREKQAFLDSGLRVFVLKRAGNYTRWEVLDLLVRNWKEIEKRAELNRGPFIDSVTKAGIRRLYPPN